MVSCSVLVRATRWHAGTSIRCRPLLSRRTIRSFGRPLRISSGGILGISFGMSSAFWSAGHWFIGFGGRVVEMVCVGPVRVRTQGFSRAMEGGLLSRFDTLGLAACCRLATRCERARVCALGALEAVAPLRALTGFFRFVGFLGAPSSRSEMMALNANTSMS